MAVEKCKTCGGTLCEVLVHTPMPDDEVETRRVAYCPLCDPTPDGAEEAELQHE